MNFVFLSYFLYHRIGIVIGIRLDHAVRYLLTGYGLRETVRVLFLADNYHNNYMYLFSL